MSDVIQLRPARPVTCDYDDFPAVARIRWADGTANVCEAHRSLVQGQDEVEVIPLGATS
jgi:hypothetical protein